MNNKIHNRKYLKGYRKSLRNNATKAERMLWKALQKSQLEGRKFRRQHSVLNYILDFYCPAEQFAIELDGGIHDNIVQKDYDYKRDRELAGLGIKVLRFKNAMVFEQMDMVLEAIKTHFKNE